MVTYLDVFYPHPQFKFALVCMKVKKYIHCENDQVCKQQDDSIFGHIAINFRYSNETNTSEITHTGSYKKFHYLIGINFDASVDK